MGRGGGGVRLRGVSGKVRGGEGWGGVRLRGVSGKVRGGEGWGRMIGGMNEVERCEMEGREEG